MRRSPIRIAATAAVTLVVAFGSLSAAPAAAAGASGASLSLEASIDGVPAAAPGPELPEGTPVTLAFTITNTGTIALGGLVLSDSVLGAIDCPRTTLDPGEAIACERYHELVPGKHRSDSVVTAATPDGTPVEASLRLGYKGLRLPWKPEITVSVLLDGGPSKWPGPTLVPGDPLEITYVVRNTGTVPLERLKVFDPTGLKVTCPTRDLAAGDTVECTVVGEVIEGRFKDRVVARAWDAKGDRVQDVQRFHYLGEEPILPAGMSVQPLAGGVSAGEAPGPMVRADASIEWSVDVTNTGETDLWGVHARDLDEGDLECRTSHLAPGDSTRCTVWGWAVGGPLPGHIEVTAWTGDGRKLTERVERHAFGFRPGPDLLLETYVNGFDADEHAGPRLPLGDRLDLTYVVHNIGTVTVRQLRVGDAIFGGVECPKRRLKPGESMTCTHHVTAELGWWETAGTAKGRYGDEMVRDADKTFWHVRTVTRVSSIDLRVTIGGHAAAGGGPSFPAGSEVEMVYIATNAGNSPLWSIEIRDPDVPFEAMACTGTDDPNPGESLTCRATLVVEQGGHFTEIEAVGWNSDGTRIVGTDSIRYEGSIPAT